MPISAEEYRTVDDVGVYRSQATKVWAITVAIAAAWLVLILAPPVAAATGNSSLSSPLYFFFSHVCHQIPDRSMFLLEHQIAVCARCLGVYAGLVIGAAFYPFWRNIDNIDPLPRKWLFLSIVPMAIDWSLTIFGIWENTHLTRFLTGAILGIACITYMIPAIVEIFRNLRHMRRASN